MKKFVRNLSVVLASALVLAVAGCNNNPDPEPAGSDNSNPVSEQSGEPSSEESKESEESEKPAVEGAEGEIHVYSRDASSGTRGAFQEIIGFGDEDKDQKVLTDSANIEDSNGALAKAVGQDEAGIGFVSLTTDFEENNLNPVSYEGIEPSEETVLSEEYQLKRPFNLVTRASGDFASDETEQLVDAFIDFLLNSIEGRDAVSQEGGIVNVEEGKPWEELKAKHPIVDGDNSALTINTSGSTSVEKCIQAALEAFQPLAGNFQFNMNQTGSGDGYKRVLGDEKDSANAAEIGFASREFKDEEKVEGALHSGAFAQDAVVVVVEKSNALTNLTQEQVRQIFTGEVTNWEDVK